MATDDDDDDSTVVTHRLRPTRAHASEGGRDRAGGAREGRGKQVDE